MSLKQKAMKGIVWIAIQNWGNQAISFVVFSVLARLLGPEAFGLVALTSIFFAFMQVFLDQGFGQAIVQRQDLDPEHLDTAFWTSVGMSLLLMGLSCASAGLIADFFKQPVLTDIIRWLSLSFLLSGLDSIQSTILTREMAFKTLAIRSLIATIAGGVVGVTMALNGFGVWSLVGQSIANGVVGVAVLWSSTKWRPGFKVSVRHFKDLFAYGVNVVGIGILNFLNRRSDDFLIGYFLGPTVLGYYTVAYRILMITSQLMISTIQRISMPVFAQLQHDQERLQRVFFNAIQITSLVAFPVFLGISVLAPELITVLFGSRWAPSIPVMQVLNLVGLLYAGFYYNGSLIMAMGKPAWNLGLNALQAVGNITFFVIAVRWGIVAVAASYVLRGYLMAPITLWVVHKVMPFNLKSYLRQYASPLLASLVMVIVMFGAKAVLGNTLDVHILLPIYIVLSIVVYAATILTIAPKLAQRAIELVRSAAPQFKIKRT